MSHVAAATHEIRGSLVWNDHGEAPYWATRELVLAADGGGTYDLDIDGFEEEIESVSLGYKGSGISPRPTDGVDQIREYKLFWTASSGNRFGGFVKPRFEADEFRCDESEKSFEERERIAVLEDLGEAVAFSIEAGTYREPD